MGVTVVQMNVEQANIEANIEKGRAYFEEASRRGSKIIAFPEMWTSGFHFLKNMELCKTAEKTLKSLQAFCREYDIFHSGSILLASDSGLPANSHVIIDNKGNLVARYDKVHLFSLMKEHEYVHAGNELVSAETPIGKLGLSVCYDLRFCELFRSYALDGAAAVALPSAFLHPRLSHWQTLIKARAIENQLLMIAPNQCGTEDFSFLEAGVVEYCGHSMIVDPTGEVLVEAGDNIECLLTIDSPLFETSKKMISSLADRRTDVYEL